MKDLDKILNEYIDHCSLYSNFCARVKELIENLLKEKDFRVHSITSRVKAKDSLESKLKNSIVEYSKLEDITDIVGVRIITYFADDVDLIAKVIKKEFEIDEFNSIDKRSLIDPDRFGYLSLHYVVKISSSRLLLTEYNRFSNCKAEVQIRSLLQHTWAEIEHDLGYKSKQSTPREVTRAFSRIAGLLEIADLEFVRIRNDLKKYEQEVAKEIKITPKKILLNKSSLLAYIENSRFLKELDSDIAKLINEQIETEISNTQIDILISNLRYLGIEKIGNIDDLLIDHKKEIVGFAKEWLKGKENIIVQRGDSLVYLATIIACSKNSLEAVIYYMNELNLKMNMKDIKSLAYKLLNAYSKYKENNPTNKSN
jgi:ppGpp synthetase/RelA/SpoT-type nucleotidyltranferase